MIDENKVVNLAVIMIIVLIGIAFLIGRLIK